MRRHTAPRPAVRVVSAALAAAVACAAMTATPAPAQVPPDRTADLDLRRRQRQDEFRSMQNMVAAMQPADAGRLDDVVRLSVEDRLLAAASPLLATDAGRAGGQFRVDAAPLKGPAYASVSTMIAVGGRLRRRIPAPAFVPPGQQTYQVLTLYHYDMPTPDELRKLEVQVQPNSFYLQRNSQFTEGNRLVRLTATRLPGGRGGGGGSVQLVVNEYGNAFAAGALGQPRSLNLQQPDLPSFVREYPREVEQYVRPLLRQIGQETVLAPHPNVAWQVFRAAWRPDAEVAERVAAVLPALDDPDWSRRDRALRELESMGRAAAAVLLALDRTEFSAERNLLIDRVLGPFAQLEAAEAARLRSDKSFLLDCLFLSDVPLRAAALARLRELADDPFEFDPAAPDDRRAAAVAALRERLLGPPPGSPAVKAAPATTTSSTTMPAK